MKAPRALARQATVAIAAVVLAFVASIGPEAAGTDIRVDFDKTFSFAGQRTWSWHPDGAGDVRLAVSSQDDPKAVAGRVDPIIIPGIEREMTGRGFTRMAEGTDLRLHYYVLATVTQSQQVAGQFLPATPEWGVPPFTPQVTSLSIFPVGTLIIDVTSASKQAIVWRGIAQRKIDIERPDAERRKVLEKAIRDLLTKFPPKK